MAAQNAHEPRSLRALLALLCVASACASFDTAAPTADADSGTTNGGDGDGSVRDGGIVDADGDAGPANQVASGDFESDEGAGCGVGWTSENATLELTTTSHRGLHGCQVCFNAPGAFSFSLISPDVQVPTTGGKYRVRAWVIRPEGLDPRGTLFHARLNGSGSGEMHRAFGTPTNWESREEMIAVPTDIGSGARIAAVVQLANELLIAKNTIAPGVCVVVDDVEITRVP